MVYTITTIIVAITIATITIVTINIAIVTNTIATVIIVIGTIIIAAITIAIHLQKSLHSNYFLLKTSQRKWFVLNWKLE